MSNVTSFGAGPPTDSKYQQIILRDFKAYPDDSKYDKHTVEVRFPNGFTLKEFMNGVFDAEGNVLDGITDGEMKGCLGATRTMLESVGYSKDQIDNGDIDVGPWLTDPARQGYVELTVGRAMTPREKQAKAKGAKAPRDCYSSVKFINKSIFDYGRANEATQAVNSAEQPATAAPRGKGKLPTPA